MNQLDAELDDPRVFQAVKEYLSALESGDKPDRLVFVSRHPEIAKALNECLAGLDLIHAAGPKLRQAAPLQSTEAPTALGDFQIIREIGRGGMGVVYEAQQVSLNRRVALKVLPFAAALDTKHLRRFHTEAHAAAQLHHTNIVPVHAVGNDRGVHYYAMQLIEGRSLDEVIREQRGEIAPAGATTLDLQAAATAAGTTSPRTVSRTSGRDKHRAAARIAVQVADALAYAHDAGVIHRDIKPANLLVDARGTVWVTDFGLAQVTADVTLTQTGDIFGTVRYMSPEQASGQRVLVDQRTDVYSLGATLYELLTLEPIFSARDRRALLNQVLNEEPRPLRQIDRTIPVELETIVLKAVAKLPADRYASAGEMAADLRRFLEERPILARRPTLVERARKWVRRHPTPVGAAVVVLAITVFGLATGMALLAREKDRTQDALSREAREQARTQQALNAELQRAKEAELRFQFARRTADDLIRMAEEELSDRPELQSFRKRLAERALEYYQRLIEMRADDPEAVAELAVTRDRAKKIVEDLALLEGAPKKFLLRESNAVLDDLKLSPAQRNQLTELWHRQEARAHEAFDGNRGLSEEEKRHRFLELVRADEADVGTILNAAQFKRLEQLALQWKGLGAFRELSVIVALTLTVEQRDQIRAIEWGLFVRGPGGPPPSGPARKDWEPKEQEQDLKLIEAFKKIEEEILTVEQSKKWKELTGEPLKGGVPFRPFGGRPGDHKGPFNPGGPKGSPKSDGPKPPDRNPDFGN